MWRASTTFFITARRTRPHDAAWPGWLFYASTHFEPNNPTWRDFPALNAYITRCQSVLQAGKPDNDVLLYWPLHDLWQRHPQVFGLTIEGKWLESEPVGDTAQQLWDAGYTYDYVSDRQLGQATADASAIHLPGGTYKTVLVPPCKFMPLPTLQTLFALARNGATILFQNELPQDVPGMGDLEHRRALFHALLSTLIFQQAGQSQQTAQSQGAGNSQVAGANSFRLARLGKGRILVGQDVKTLLAQAQVRRESMADNAGLMFVRRSYELGHHYFVVNQGEKALDGWVTLAVPARSIVLMDPMTGQTGTAKTRQGQGGQTQVYLQIAPGASLIVRALTNYALTNRAPTNPAWPYLQAAGEPIALAGTWQVRFLTGGPILPSAFTTPALGSWTANGDPETQRFGGTARYTLTFNAPHTQTRAGESWTLDLGDVRESAHVRLNGQELGTLFAPPFQVTVSALKPTGNVLEIDVTNVAANRVRDLDRRKVAWKIFHEINFVNINYKPFDASDWPIRPSGLLGPVRITLMRPVK